MSALEHDERCEMELLIYSCRCEVRRDLAASRQREEEAKEEVARLTRIECWWCGRAPTDEPGIQLFRLNPTGLRGVFECQHCRHPELATQAQVTALREAIQAINVRCYPSGSTIIDPPDEAGAAQFWTAIRAVKALALPQDGAAK